MSEIEGKPPTCVVQVSIVSFRTAEFVKKAIAALEPERELLATHGIQLDCFVIDNSQEDYEAIRQDVEAFGRSAWVTVVCAERNGGFAYGNNRGFEFGFARATRPDYFYLLNPDAAIRPGAILELVSFLESNPEAATAASGIEDEQGVLWPFAFRFPNIGDELLRGLRIGLLSRWLDRYAVPRRMSGATEQVDWFPGAAMLCRASVIAELGGMDESYFLYYEETDFCLKLVRHGWTNWYVPKSRVIHATGQSTGVTAAGNEAHRLPKYWFESRRRYFLKNHGPWYAVSTDIVAIIAHAVGRLLLSLRGKGSQLRKSFLRDLLLNSALTPQGRVTQEVKDRLSVSQ
jgi:N-acetylglucosaminyl-diphospho-decaprenol L-rhamnosyltransferase